MRSPTNLGNIALRIGLMVAVIAAIGLISTVPVQQSYVSRALLVQRVQQDKTGGSLFGDDSAYRDIGSPQRLIVDDQKAFLPGESGGVKRVDEDYLTTHKIYPLELQTVEYGVKLTRFGLGAALIAGLLTFAVGRKFSG